MIALVTKLDPAWYSPRSYVVAATDTLGHRKAAQAEAALLLSEASSSSSPTLTPTTTPPPPTVITLPRAREVGQSYLSSIFTTLRAMWAAVALAFSQRPDLLLVNGPGTCLPVVIADQGHRAGLRGEILPGEGLLRRVDCEDAVAVADREYPVPPASGGPVLRAVAVAGREVPADDLCREALLKEKM